MLAMRQILLGPRGAKLPYDAEVEYLESADGLQFIDTGLIGSQLYSAGGLEIECMPLTLSGFTPVANIDNDHNLNFLGLNNRDDYIYSRFNDQGRSLPSEYFGITTFLNQRITQKAIDSVVEITIGNVTQTWNYTQFCANNSSPLYLFYCRNPFGSGNWLGRFRVYHATCWYDAFTVAFDFIPVRFTNEIGQSEGAMYDRVSGHLFRNAGTGAFTIGPDKS